MRSSVPVVILGGADPRPAKLPEAGRDKHPLSGYKGIDVRIGERSLVSVVAERLRAAGGFGPIYVVGPSRLYRDVPGHDGVIDSDGSFGENIRAAIDAVRQQHPGRSMAFITCDVLPAQQSLVELMELYEAARPCDMWYPMIRVPEDRSALGASAWKPVYTIASRTGPAAEVLPCHLAIVDPGALRLDFLYRLIDLGYRTRNRSIAQRRGVMVRGVLFEILYEDLRQALALRPPTLTWTVLTDSIPGARSLGAGTLTDEQAERRLRRLFVSQRHRRDFPDRRVRLPIVDALSLALDIDTEEEAREAGGDMGSRSA